MNLKARDCIVNNLSGIPPDLFMKGGYSFKSKEDRILRVLTGKYLIIDKDEQGRLIKRHKILLTEKNFKDNPRRVFDPILYVAGPKEAVDLMWQSVEQDVWIDTNILSMDYECFIDDDSIYITSWQLMLKDLEERPEDVEPFIAASQFAYQNMKTVFKEPNSKKLEAVKAFLRRPESTDS